MKIAIVGLFHLGCVTAACLAAGKHEVTAYDPDKLVMSELKQGKPPIFEPGLTELLQAGIKSKQLSYSNDLKDIQSADIVWVTYDTPVDNQDNADTAWVREKVQA